MEKYEITREQLEVLVKEVYEIGVCGYLDLKDSLCDSIVDEFLQKLKPNDVSEKFPTSAIRYQPQKFLIDPQLELEFLQTYSVTSTAPEEALLQQRASVQVNTNF